MTAAVRRLGGPTFRARLTLGMTLLSLVVLASASTVIYLWAREALRATFDSALFAVAQIEVASAIDEPGGSVHAHESPPAPPPPRIGAGYEKVVRMRSQDGTIDLYTIDLERGPALETDPALEARAFNGQVSFGDARRGNTIYRCVYYPFTDPQGHKLIATVAIPKGPLERTLWSLLGVLAACLVLGGAGAALGANRLARRLTQPLEQIAEGAKAVGEAGPGARIPDVSPDQELRDVTTILNEMLGRLETVFENERRFLADASHELRSPLTNVRGTIEVALRRPRSEVEYRETLGVSLAEIERLSRLVNALLTLSRADAGKLPFTFAPCQLAAVVENAVMAHASRAAERSVRLELAAPEPFEVLADADRLREVIDNLIDNALRYAPPGSAVVVSVRREGDRARLSVQDSGPGLSLDEQAHAFDRFYRADPSRARHSGGTGLGLSIAKAIVGAHRGRLSVQSAPGQGSTFLVDLPIPSGGQAGAAA